MKGVFGKIVKYALTLFIVTALASGSLAYTYSITKDRIEKLRLREQINAVKEVCPGAKGAEVSKNVNLENKLKEKISIITGVFEVKKGTEVVAYAILTAPRGYGGPMSVIVGISSDGKVTGVKVIEHRETPGLGDKVVGSKDFLSQFKDKTPDDAVKIKEDIEAVSGATISSKGVTAGVRAALDAYELFGAGDSK